MRSSPVDNAFAQPRFARRCLARGGLFALLVVPFVAVDRAEAACAPTAPVNNTTITCSGATTNQNGTDGYGTNSDTGNTYNILSGASITGTNFGLRFNTLGTVNNSGSITGAGTNEGGIFGLVVGTVNNAGFISATGANSAGVTFNGTGFVINSGSISGGRQGVRLQNGEVTNTETGAITGVTNGVEIVDVAKVSNAGAISGGVRGVSISPANSSSNVEIANSGIITGALNGIETLRRVDLTNSGSISGTGQAATVFSAVPPVSRIQALALFRGISPAFRPRRQRQSTMLARSRRSPRRLEQQPSVPRPPPWSTPAASRARSASGQCRPT